MNISRISKLNVIDTLSLNTIENQNFKIDFIDEIENVDAHLIHFVVKGTKHCSKMIRPSHYKSISAINKTSRKPFPQKRTGNARQGSLASIHMRGGAVAFGFSENAGSKSRLKSHFKINKKIKALAYIHIIKNKYDNEKILLFNDWKDFPVKTKDIADFKNKLGIKDQEPCLFVYDTQAEYSALLAIRNLKNCNTISASSVNVIDLLKNHYILFDIKSLTKFLSLRNL